MNTQTKIIALNATRFGYAPYGFSRLMLIGLLLTGLMHPALAVETATPNMASDRNCQQGSMDVQQGIKSRLPADPKKAQAILNLKHQGDELCHNGSNRSGLAKLQQAASLLGSVALPDQTPQQ